MVIVLADPWEWVGSSAQLIDVGRIDLTRAAAEAQLGARIGCEKQLLLEVLMCCHQR
jgi:hypothetical protein